MGIQMILDAACETEEIVAQMRWNSTKMVERLAEGKGVEP